MVETGFALALKLHIPPPLLDQMDYAEVKSYYAHLGKYIEEMNRGNTSGR